MRSSDVDLAEGIVEEPTADGVQTAAGVQTSDGIQTAAGVQTAVGVSLGGHTDGAKMSLGAKTKA